jgi:hypothetical protein
MHDVRETGNLPYIALAVEMRCDVMKTVLLLHGVLLVTRRRRAAM